MIGTNTMSLNEATVIAAMQHYFDTVIFAPGKAPKVTGVTQEGVGGGREFRILMIQPQPLKDASS